MHPSDLFVWGNTTLKETTEEKTMGNTSPASYVCTKQQEVPHYVYLMRGPDGRLTKCDENVETLFREEYGPARTTEIRCPL